MAVYKRFNGKRIRPSDPNWYRGTWVVEFNLRGHRVREAIPEAQTKKQAEQVETQIKQAIFDRKYNRASAVTRFSEFVDGVFLLWALENKRSYKDDEQRAAKLKESGIGDFHFHDLRHTFATRLRAANIHEYDIADLLGHSTTPGETRNTKVTRGYAHGVPQRLRGAVDSLEEGKRLISATPTLRQVARGA